MGSLIIFSRYPQPGTTKTRLIPALGAEGAAALQRCMAERLVEQGRLLRDRFDLTLQICFTGGSLPQLQAWLGADLHYQVQGEGDLGDRLQAALQHQFQVQPSRPIVVVGTDCPGISADLLQRSFQHLQAADLVIGPALDGGYYLIGLNQYHPELFEGITWSSDRVLRQTLAIAQRLKLSWVELEPLPDIDRPEDLQFLPPELCLLFPFQK